MRDVYYHNSEVDGLDPFSFLLFFFLKFEVEMFIRLGNYFFYIGRVSGWAIVCLGIR
jgi:hypothetical protein